MGSNGERVVSNIFTDTPLDGGIGGRVNSGYSLVENYNLRAGGNSVSSVEGLALALR